METMRNIARLLLAACLAAAPGGSGKAAMRKDAVKKPNRLIHEKSPYLLQHADNPVDWYPWGPEAFEKARREDKPILLSIGYSTCHWCHVMERESFEDPAIAAVMNKYLVCIKLDREERPDIDKIYMTAVSAMTGSGGWPLNAFLTHDLKPFYGGTYFPPEDRWGRLGWPRVVERIGEAWKDPENRKKLVESAENVSKGVARYLSPPGEEGEAGAAALDNAFGSFRGSFDARLGGFGPAPKFPMPVNQNFLFRYHASTGNKEALSMALATLRAMARGGIYDHLGGGFARYSTDERWHVPHFEKMLYDNAQLAVNFLEAYQLSRDGEFARVARETLDYVRRDMTHPQGGFYSAEDADSLPSPQADHKKEGAFYVWEKEEVLKVLGAEAGEVFAFRYGVEKGGNALEDPHGEFPNKNVLYAAQEVADVAKRFGKTESEVAKTLEDSKRKLFAERAERPRPHLDDKVLTSWNGLMISAFAKAAQVLGEPAYEKSAVEAARFLKEKLWDARGRRLYRRWRDGERAVPGTADDYAFLAQALTDLYETDFDPAWLDWAVELAEVLLKDFYDAKAGGFFMTAPGHDEHLLMRVKESSDNVEPSADSVAALTLLRLADFTDRKDFRAAADKTLRAFALVMNEQPRAAPQMLCALDRALGKSVQVVIAAPSAAAGAALLKTVRARFLPNKIVLLADGGARQAALAERLPFLKGMVPVGGKPTAYVCVDYACRLPVTDPAALEAQLGAPAER
jgi:uncharacterized protein